MNIILVQSWQHVNTKYNIWDKRRRHSIYSGGSFQIHVLRYALLWEFKNYSCTFINFSVAAVKMSCQRLLQYHLHKWRAIKERPAFANKFEARVRIQANARDAMNMQHLQWIFIGNTRHSSWGINCSPRFIIDKFGNGSANSAVRMFIIFRNEQHFIL